MPERIENRMVVDHEWNFLSRQYAEVQEVLSEPGYMQFGSNLFVPEKEAYDYALAQCLYGSEEDQKEFKKMLVEWFYSGNWRCVSG